MIKYRVAPSFENFELVREAYTKNNKLYCDVRNPRTGTVRSVRIYTDREYAKAYPHKVNWDRPDSLKIPRGFAEGPITLLRTKDEDWLRRNKECRYATDVGWYIVSTEKLPEDPAPADLKINSLSWEEFKTKYI